jgi:hypothetical protein
VQSWQAADDVSGSTLDALADPLRARFSRGSAAAACAVASINHANVDSTTFHMLTRAPRIAGMRSPV